MKRLAFAQLLLAVWGCSSSQSSRDGSGGGDGNVVREQRSGEMAVDDRGRDGSAIGPRWESLKDAPSLRNHTATLLQDGTVLVAGGEQEITLGDKTLPTDTWRYLPATKSFVAAGQFKGGRTGHTATLLSDGRVLVVGGQNNDGTFYKTVHLFNPIRPITEAWTFAAALPEARSRHTAVRLGDGRVAVIGGSGVDGGGARFDLDTIVIFDPESDTWSTAVPKLKQGRCSHTATLLNNGKVLIAGGLQSGVQTTWLDTLEIWDPTVGAVATSSVKMTQPRAYQSAHLLTNGNVFLVGGRCGDAGSCTLLNDQLYVPNPEQLLEVAHQGQPPAGHASTMLLDGRVVVTGSWDKSDAGKAVVFTPEQSSWVSCPDMPHPRGSHTATWLGDKSVLLIGGDAASGVTQDVADRLFNL